MKEKSYRLYKQIIKKMQKYINEIYKITVNDIMHTWFLISKIENKNNKNIAIKKDKCKEIYHFSIFLSLKITYEGL